MSQSELIPVAPQQIGQDTIQTVNARELHVFLENGDHFATWIKERISQYGFAEDADFTIFRQMPKKGRPVEEYFLSLDMAKEISMVERNEKGKQARRYFIECEQLAKEAIQRNPALSEKEILTQAMQIINAENAALNKQIEILAPRADFADAISIADGGISINVFAKILRQHGIKDMGPHRLYEDLRKGGFIIRQRGKNWNVPVQRYVEKGWFRIIEYLTPEDDCIQHITQDFAITGAGQHALLAHFMRKYGLNRQRSLFDNSRNERTRAISRQSGRGRLQKTS
jgi:anti-repressor protein